MIGLVNNFVKERIKSKQNLDQAKKLKDIRILVCLEILIDIMGLFCYSLFFIRPDMYWYGGISIVKAISGNEFQLILYRNALLYHMEGISVHCKTRTIQRE